MITRTISAVVGIGLFLGLCFAGTAPFAWAVTVLALLASWEWIGAYRHGQVTRSSAAATASDAMLPGDEAIIGNLNAARLSPLAEPASEPPSVSNAVLVLVGAFTPLLVRSLMLTRPQQTAQFALLLGMFVFVFACRVFRAARTGEALGRLRRLYGLVGLVYIGLLLSSFVLLRGLPGRITVVPFGTVDRGAWILLLVTVCVWATDTFAYFVGRGMGRRKLAPSLSPKKTVEGSVGGLVGAVVTGALFADWIGIAPLHGFAVGALAGTIGQIGDLWESALKREAGLKDFGAIMPGHGGVLDRFDSLLFVAPLAYLYLRLVVHL